MKQSDSRQKRFAWRKIILHYRNHLPFIEVKFHLDGMNSFSYKLCFQKMKFSILLRSHSGQISHSSRMLRLLLTALQQVFKEGLIAREKLLWSEQDTDSFTALSLLADTGNFKREQTCYIYCLCDLRRKDFQMHA